MAQVASYDVIAYGGPAGYQTNRAQIALYDSGGNSLAWVRFNDPGMVFENDSVSAGVILMHLPSAMFQSVLDILRNETPVTVQFSSGVATISTSVEPIGEGEA